MSNKVKKVKQMLEEEFNGIARVEGSTIKINVKYVTKDGIIFLSEMVAKTDYDFTTKRSGAGLVIIVTV